MYFRVLDVPESLGSQCLTHWLFPREKAFVPAGREIKRVAPPFPAFGTAPDGGGSVVRELEDPCLVPPPFLRTNVKREPQLISMGVLYGTLSNFQA